MSKRKKQRQSDWQRWLRRNAGWVIFGALGAAGAVVILVLVLSGGSSSDETSGSAATPTPDPRIGNATPAASVTVQADDGGQNVNPRFVPDQISGEAGQVLEIKVENVGTVAHNLRVAGADRQYDTPDDFASRILAAGAEAALLVKLDDAGTYPFRCDLHPQQQVGTLVIN